MQLLRRQSRCKSSLIASKVRRRGLAWSFSTVVSAAVRQLVLSRGYPLVRSGALGVTDLGGAGLVVLAAAKDDQEALELGQHGLFTAAILRVLQDGPNWTDIGVLMEEVTKQVRAEASRTGHEQTPVWAGLIKGGIELPRRRLYGRRGPAPASGGVSQSVQIGEET